MSRRYRKIPGDKCQGGFNPLSIKKHCETVSPSSNLPIERSKGMLALIVVCSCVGLISLVIGAALIITSRKMNCRHRLPAYHFSALQLQDDDVCINQESGPSSIRHSLAVPDDSDDDLIE